MINIMIILNFFYVQMFSSVKLNAITLLTNAHASLLSWTVDPSLVRLDVINNTRFAQLTTDINTVLARSLF
jgi:hypothetical protein